LFLHGYSCTVFHTNCSVAWRWYYTMQRVGFSRAARTRLFRHIYMLLLPSPAHLYPIVSRRDKLYMYREYQRKIPVWGKPRTNKAALAKDRVNKASLSVY
jgi:hypothetical protein